MSEIVNENVGLRVSTVRTFKTPSWARQAQGAQTFGFSRKTFDQLEDWIKDNEASKVKAQYGMQELLRLCILVVKSSAMQKSRGPVAPRQRSVPALAAKIPVQRITGVYYSGWQIRKTARGYKLYNDSTEAYLIETGMFQRVRRPILKLSVMDMLRFIQSTRTADRFVDWIFAPRRSPNGRIQSFEQRIKPFVALTAEPRA